MNETALPKHVKYKSSYGANEIYHGFGVEHETYLESAVFMTVPRADLKKYRHPERYSVPYYKNYKTEDLDRAFDTLPETVSLVPVLLNSHSFTYCDISMNHRTTYERIQRPNPRFHGRTLHDSFYAASPWYRDAYDHNVVYDGDTFEFMSVDFYNASVEDALMELWETEDRFLWEFNNYIMATGSPLTIYGPYGLTRSNYPFAKHLTNPHHYSMFNNGTVHVNITLPTRLDGSGAIADMDDFRRRHQLAARYFQWFEPLLAVAYGAPDPFSCVDTATKETHYSDVPGKCVDMEEIDLRPLFSPASQRLAVSRYIGLATYDTEKMNPGKILVLDVSGSEEGYEDDWYTRFYERSAYVKLTERGLDINYRKHWNHGIELRIFDGLRRDQMLDVCRLCWKLCLESSELDSVEDCRRVPWFQEFILGCMLHGSEYVVEWPILKKYLDVIHRGELLDRFSEKDIVCIGEVCRVVLGL